MKNSRYFKYSQKRKLLPIKDKQCKQRKQRVCVISHPIGVETTRNEPSSKYSLNNESECVAHGISRLDRVTVNVQNLS